MFAEAVPWIAFFLFFAAFWGLTFLEAFWLSRRGWAVFSRSLTFAISSNLLGLFIGASVVFVILLILFMLTLEPIKNPAANEFIMWMGVVLALVFPPIFLTLTKRLLLRLFKLGGGQRLWRFSIASSVLMVFVSIAVPAAFVYLSLKIFS